MNESIVGVIGATGAAGREAVRALTDPTFFGEPTPVLRLGGRRPDAVQEIADEFGGSVVAVDLEDPAALAEFCAGCTVVLSCAGPSYTIGDRIARAAWAAGADFADVSGYDPVYGQLVALNPEADGRAAVLSAGIYPGLSTLIPRWLVSQGLGDPVGLSAYVGGIEEATVGSAADLVLSIGDGAVWGSSGAGLAAWRDGRRQEHRLRVAEDIEVPFFPDRLTAQPFLSSEAERLAANLGLVELDWYNVFIGDHMRTALNRLRGGSPDDPEALEASARELMRACELDVGGRESYYVMAYWMHGRANGRPTRLTGVLRCDDTFQVTGAVGALAVRALLAGEVPPGVHMAAEALDPADTVTRIRGLPSVLALESIDTTSAADEEVEVGAL
ncbi:putative NAD(P)-binding protein [Herbihabitans rhizosphaerae]|uniref:Putative NAD(P)-binding protein n=1 Tax=Herbihabitans rhizosphaerae TaxID=1872711 RepID=A0A4V2EUL8_9PSEU|nr:NAD(P)H-binding protein [Herbihabitans rhizosphaerae]RZS45023.1 putative NAD(P)-binding protein [Herbihabitans rhizosphaerae]